MSSPVLVPFHQDEPLAPDTIPMPGPGYRTVLPGLPDGTVWERLVALYREVAATVAEVEGTPVVLSGDCTVALGTLAGVQRRGIDPAIVWFDAHGDVHTRESSTSGYIGGMSLRLALGAHADLMAEPLGLRPVAADRMVLVGARDLDPGERAYLSTAPVRQCAVDAITMPEGPVLLHIDVDVITAEEVPGLLYPVTGGPSRDAVLDSVRRVIATGRVVALDIACPWKPDEYPERADLIAALTGLLDTRAPGAERE
ncbi:arginase family protein [Nocardia sp. CC227C]|uniref:arginase family protein n=1 Tax=Nocardia sp. CC227C TaxID=3044562 RepID=UPI00278C0041|nr:arginase family protein [Nocardia sp. CC227C]